MTHTCHFHGNRDSLQTTKLTNKDCPPSDLFPHNSTQGSKLFNQQPRRSSFEKPDTQTQHLHRTPSIFPGTQAGFLFSLCTQQPVSFGNHLKFLQETLHRTGCPGLPSDRQSRVPLHRLSFSLSIQVLSRTPGTCLIQRQAQFTS